MLSTRKLTLAGLLVALSAPSMLAGPSGAKPLPRMRSHTPRPAVRARQSARDGFPSARQLGGLKNYVSAVSVSTLLTTQYVHSPSNYKQTLNGNRLVTILYRHKVYAQLGSFKRSRSIEPASRQDQPALYGYATQLDNLFKSPAFKAFRTGSCVAAGRAGQQWDIRTVGASNRYADEDFRACTAKRGGYLLTLSETARLGTAKPVVSASLRVLSIGRVPAYTPADL